MNDRPARIGLIGYGYIGKYLHRQIRDRPELGLAMAFISDQDPDRLAEVPPELVLGDPANYDPDGVDLIVEAAHPSVTRALGALFLQRTDYMPLSLTALADPGRLESLTEIAERNRRCLYIPHGAVVGLESLYEGREIWEEVTVTMRKHPNNLDFSRASGFSKETIDRPTLLYDGPTRGVCPLFPRNVNAHAAVAIAGLGFDRTHSILFADPSLNGSTIELEARGQGVEMRIQRSNPLKGVSGIYTLLSTLSGVLRAKGREHTLQIC